MLVTGLALIIAGLAFKSSSAPFHMWTPDVYQGAPTPVTAFMASATKIAAFAVIYRIVTTAFPGDVHQWRWAFAVIACISLAWGNIAALAQQNVKRILAYSSVSHAGFMLIAVAAANQLGAKALVYYLVPYSAMSLGAFAVVAARERELGAPVTLTNLSGFGWERPYLGGAMWVFMLGFLGFPLTGGFIGKFYVFAAAYRHGWWWLIVAGVIATMISAYYYLGVVRAMYFRDRVELQLAPAGGSPPREVVLGYRRRPLPGRHRRLVLRRPAADRHRALGRAVAAALATGDQGLAGRRTRRRPCCTAATLAFTAKIARQPMSAERPSGGRVCVAASGDRAAHETTSSVVAAPHRSACRPTTASSRASRNSPKASSAATAAKGTAARSAFRARPCEPCPSRIAAAIVSRTGRTRRPTGI